MTDCCITMTADVPGWMQNSAPGDSVIAATALTLVRNIDGFAFPASGRDEELKAVRDVVCGVFRRYGILGRKRKYIDGGSIDRVSAAMLLERGMISASFKEKMDLGGVFLNADQDTAVVVNDCDHLQLKFFASGNMLKNLWRRANLLDNRLACRMKFAFDPELGYLSSTPDMLGTGLQAKVLMHLPALEFSGALEQVLNSMLQMRIGVTGYGGEGCGKCGCMYVFSNIGTLGESETEIIARVSAVTEKVRAQERNMRLEIMKKDKYTLLDKVSRAYGLLRHCYLLSEGECLSALSWLRLGVDLGMFEHLDMASVDYLAFFAGEAHLARRAGKNEIPSQGESAQLRAEVARDNIGKSAEAID